MKAIICVVLDRSGSMGGRENDVINGVNAFLEDQKKLPDAASIAFVRFDTEATERFRPMQALAECQPLTREDYKPRGGTPLLDAVGKTIVQLDDDWKAEKPERAIMVIVTDGEENSSREYTKAKIQELVKARQDSGKWAFIYLGANVDAFYEAGQMGITTANTAGYTSSAKGTKAMFATASASLSQMRKTGSTVSHNLGGTIEEDGNVAMPTTPSPTAPAKPWTAPDTASWTPPS